MKPSDLLQQRKIITDIMFNQFDVPNIFFLKKPVLGCFATGRSTALVVDSGEFSTRVVGVHEGFTLNKSSKIIPYGGHTLNRQIEKFCEENNHSLATRFDLSGDTYTKSFLNFQRSELIKDIKEHFPMKNPDEIS